MNKKIIFMIFIFSFTSIFICIKNSEYENNKIEDLLEEFVSLSTIKETYTSSQYSIVSRETYNKEYEEKSENRLAITSDQLGNRYIGSPGDILLTKDAPRDMGPLRKPIGYVFGGHAAIVSTSSTGINPPGDLVIDSVGNFGNDDVKEKKTDWTIYSREVTVGIRVKGFTKNDYSTLVENARKEIGKKYNYLFIVNTKNTYYCTDFVSRLVYNTSRINLNDGFVTTCNDLILSDNSYIFYYQYIDDNGFNHIYYLDY